MKQNYPIRNFFGENENIIKIRVWSILIADLLTKIFKSKLKKNWSFSNLCSMIRIYLMTYVDLINFLNNPEKSILTADNRNSNQLNLFNKDP